MHARYSGSQSHTAKNRLAFLGGWQIVIVLSLAIPISVGCGSADTESGEQASKTKTPTSQVSESNDLKVKIREQLVGVWLGAAYIDEASLVSKLEQLPPQESEEILRQAQYFSGTMMAIDFRQDGSLENEIEIIPPNGQPQREQGYGTWKIAQIADEGFVVEIAEEHADGSITKSQKIYRFYEDGDHFAVSIPLDNVLGECNPLIVFERQNLSPKDVLAEAARNAEKR